VAAVRTLNLLTTVENARVREGYIRSTTAGHARTSLLVPIPPLCRPIVHPPDRPGTPVRPSAFHRKEGVDGSSPSEGSARAPHAGAFSLSRSDRLADSALCGGYGAVYGAPAFETPPVHQPAGQRNGEQGDAELSSSWAVEYREAPRHARAIGAAARWRSAPVEA